MITKWDWWIGVILIVMAVLTHALIPRYEWHHDEARSIYWTRMDRWTGSAALFWIDGEGMHQGVRPVAAR